MIKSVERFSQLDKRGMVMPEWIEIIVRSIFLIIGLFLISKVLGKKQLSKLSFFEYVVGITIGDIAGTLSMDSDLNIINGFTSILTWASIPILVSYISLKSPRFQQFIEGKPTVFIQNGKILEENLKKENFTANSLLEQLRKKDIFRVADVEFATLETTGDISVLKKKEKQPVEFGEVFQPVPPMDVPQTVIEDGTIETQALAKIGKSPKWLYEELSKKGIKLKEVFLAQVDSTNRLTIDLYDDFQPSLDDSFTDWMMTSLNQMELEMKMLPKGPFNQFVTTNQQRISQMKNKLQTFQKE